MSNLRLAPEFLGAYKTASTSLSVFASLLGPLLPSFGCSTLFSSRSCLSRLFRYALFPSSSCPRPALRSSCVPARFASPTYPRYPPAPRRMRDHRGRPHRSRVTRYSYRPWLGRCVDFPLKRSRVTVLFDPDSSTTDVCLCLSAFPLDIQAVVDANLLANLGGVTAINTALELLVRRQNRLHIHSRPCLS